MSQSGRSPQRLVVKVGASVLIDRDGTLSGKRLRQVVEEVHACRVRHQQVVLVSSGAIACGMQRLRLRRRPKELAHLQACAAIGQGELMRQYSEAFRAHEVVVAQVLLTESDIVDRTRCRNATHTINTLLSKGVIPIVNENDAVSVEEIAFGDNDRLAALVASVISAQLLVLLTDVDGLLHEGKVIERVEQLSQVRHTTVLGSSRETTTGGMTSKLAAARIVRHSGIPMIIANGTKAGILGQVLDGKPVGTLIVPPSTRLKFRKWWIAFSARLPKGTVVIDEGAAEALRARGKSLLPSGIRGVEGRFSAGDPVAIVDEGQREVARGISNFSAGELNKIRGLKSQQIAQTLGHKTADEAVHRDNLVLVQDLEEDGR